MINKKDNVKRDFSKNPLSVFYVGGIGKYYQITAAGKEQQKMLAQEWEEYDASIRKLITCDGQTTGGGADE